MPWRSSKRRPFETWRKTMIAGSLVLLATALAQAIVKADLPAAVGVIGYGLGYALLAIGFAVRMRERPGRHGSDEHRRREEA